MEAAVKFLVLVCAFLASVALADESINIHQFDGLDLSRYHARNPETQVPLMEGIVLYMCITQDCAQVWDAYYQSNAWVRNMYEGAQHYGDTWQKTYLPEYAAYLAAPLAGAAMGHGELHISHNEDIVINLKVPSVAYRYNF